MSAIPTNEELEALIKEAGFAIFDNKIWKRIDTTDGIEYIDVTDEVIKLGELLVYRVGIMVRSIT
jgi:ribose 5-phosphate isomerase